MPLDFAALSREPPNVRVSSSVDTAISGLEPRAQMEFYGMTNSPSAKQSNQVMISVQRFVKTEGNSCSVLDYWYNTPSNQIEMITMCAV